MAIIGQFILLGTYAAMHKHNEFFVLDDISSSDIPRYLSQ